MARILELFRFQLNNKYTIFKQKNFSLFLVQFLKYLVIIAAITIGLYLLANKIVFALTIKINAEFIAIVLLVTQVISFCFAVAGVISTLYLSKDNELLVVLPVTFNQLFISKILVLYVSDLIFNLLYIFPILLTLGFLGGLPITFFLMAVIILPLLPILPIGLASIVGIPIMFIVKYLRSKPKLAICLILIAVASLFIAYMSIVTSISGAFNIADKQIETGLQINSAIASLGSSIPIFYWLAQSMLNLSLFYYIIAFLGISLAIMLICFSLIKPFYHRVVTIYTENIVKQTAKYKKFKKRKPFTALLLNETRSVFRSPSYIFQYFLFPLFMPLIVYTYDKLLISIAVNQAGEAMILGSHMLVLCLIALMSNTISSSAISREGGNFYIAKSTPTNFYTQVWAKITFNAVFTLGAILITTIITLAFNILSPLAVILTSLACMLLSFGHICHSFDMDLQKPVLDWYDNSEISTIGKSTKKSMLYALIIAVVMCLLLTFLTTKILLLGYGLVLLISIIYCIGRIYLLHIRTEHYYNLMEI